MSVFPQWRGFALVLFPLLWTLGLQAEARLGFTASRLGSLRSAAEKPEDTRGQILQMLRQSVTPEAAAAKDATTTEKPVDTVEGLSARATRAAAVFAVTGKAEYAEAAYAALRATQELSKGEDGSREFAERGAHSLALAYVWDWAKDGLSADKQKWLRDAAMAELDAWVGTDEKTDTASASTIASSELAIRRGSELVQMLALGEETKRSARYALLKQELSRHMQAFDEIGVSAEGSAYPASGGPFLLKALLALRDVGDTELDVEAARHAWWRQAMYAGAFSQRADGQVRQWLVTGSGSATSGDAGWASLLLGFVPERDLPYYLWWYQHHLGTESGLPAAARFDAQGDGRVWALLLLPAVSPVLDPTGVYPTGIRGSGGTVFLRNRWKNRSDIQIAIQAGTYGISVLAHGETWLGSPGKDEGEKAATTLLVDGKAPSTAGTLTRAELWPDGALVVMEAAEAYRAFGVESAERQVLVHFHPASDDLVLSTLDRVEGAESRTYTWQVNLGEPGETRRVVRDRRFTPTPNQPLVFIGGGWPMCSVTGQGRGLEPKENLQLQYQDPLRAQKTGTKVDLWMELQWRCVGGAMDARNRAIVEFPRLYGQVVRDASGNLQLQRPAMTPVARPVVGSPSVSDPE